ncbi:MAG: low molecular weight phosphotyrosine protein phosphatase [Bacteroidetes bacterium]|nr:low molecular weight phosphotyrosine protein phosphatase [Bacteroidota bacterium]MBK8660006.1 low molecular weight phosphotyrosine protein phosphatase [Bacteroidota bacterium]
MVCLGNICRSPIAHGLLKHKADKLGLSWVVDSAGTSDWHAGELPNEKSIRVMKEHGIDITYQRSRLLTRQDLQDFELIYVMDESNLANVVNMASSEAEINKIKMIMNEVREGQNEPVPDPWGLSQQHYEEVYAMLDEATDKIIERLR